MESRSTMIRARRHGQLTLSITALAAILMGAFVLGLWTARHTRADEGIGRAQQGRPAMTQRS
jgi:hypothetical protein